MTAVRDKLPHLALFLIGWAILTVACGPAGTVEPLDGAGTTTASPVYAPVLESQAEQAWPEVLTATPLFGAVQPGEPAPALPPTATLPALEFAGSLDAAALDWLPPEYPAPWSVRPSDHFYFTRPIAASEPYWPHPRYRYGNTHFGEEPTHSGIDYVAPRGTPVLAAGPGIVLSAGYGLYGGVEDKTDPYGIAVSIRHDFGHEDQRLYTIYAHLRRVHVWPGQRVEAGDLIGEVGDTGRASGTHLHYEVRLGENRFFNTRNPELWTVPPEGMGVLAGSIMSTWGYRMEERLVQLTHLETGDRWDVWTYRRDTVHSDDIYRENFVIGDLPEGPYEIYISYWGAPFRAQFYLYPAQTNLIEFKGIEGFTVEPRAVSSSDR